MRNAEVKAPVLFIANGIGDHLLALPTVRALSHIFGNALTLVCMKNVSSLFFSQIPFRRIELIPFYERDESRWPIRILRPGNDGFDAPELTRRLDQCDLFIALTEWDSPDIRSLMAMLKPKRTLGFHSHFDIQLSGPNAHAFDRHFSAAQSIDSKLSVGNFRGPPHIEPRHASLARTLSASLSGTHLLLVQTHTKARKMWDPVKFLKAIDAFMSERPEYLTFIVGSWTDLPLQAARHRNRIVNLCGLPLSLSMALIGSANLFVGVDSWMLHAADLWEIPSVGIFGPTPSAQWGLRFTKGHSMEGADTPALTPTQVADAMVALAQDR